MNRNIVGWIFLFCLLCGTALQAQHDLSNLRRRILLVDSNVIQVDTLLFISGSVSVTNLNTNDYEVDYLHSQLRILRPELQGEKIEVAYRVFQISSDVFQKKNHKSLSLINEPLKSHRDALFFEIEEPVSYNSLWDNGLQSNGSISRGLAVGNRQDLSLQSALNLQLSGHLSDDIEILANITDQNIPLQADGTTRNLQDFNKIYINLQYKKRFSITAGDIEPSLTTDAYLKLNKRLLGLEFRANNVLDSSNLLQNVVGGGVAKGKYVSQKLSVREGVQGPYKLYGKNGETNLVILSGSERVYWDGVLLTRGQEQDYTMDYNTGEITFSARRLVTTESRIVVEFEYSDYAYTRYSLYTFNEFTHEKNSRLKFKLNFYHEQDLKNQSIEPELDDAQKLFLSGLGDATAALYPVADTVAFNTNEILYHRKDTVVEGETFAAVYVRALDGSQTCYRVQFSYQGENQGDYVLLQSGANGRLFQWVAPRGGVPQGNYAPVISLTTPKLLQMGTLSAEYQFLKNSGVKVDFAVSHYDQNTFSKENDGDNVGFAGKVTLFHQQNLKKNKRQNALWQFVTQADYEFTHRNFVPVEQYRDVEFDRLYNLTGDEGNTTQQMLHFYAAFQNQDIGTLGYRFNMFARSPIHNAIRNELTINTLYKGWKVNSLSSFLLSNDSVQNTKFVKTDNVFSKSFKKLEIGIKENLEYNLFTCQQADTLRPNSYAFNEASVFVKNSDSVAYQYEFFLKNRVDHTAQEGILSQHSMAYEAGASFDFHKIRNHRVRGNATFRQYNALDSNKLWIKENNFVGSLEYSGRFCKNAIVVTTYYEAGGGLEPKRTFSYLKVAAGQGTHVWKDYNGNGLEDLDEFETAVFQDEANYIKIWLTGNEYVSTFNNKFTQTLQLRPAAVWSGKRGVRRVLAMFANMTTLRAGQKNCLDHSANAFNPFYADKSDSLLVSQNLLLKNDFSFHLPNHYFGFDFSVQKSQNKNLLYYGAESTTLDLQELVLKSLIHNILTIKTDYIHSVKDNVSEFFASRTFEIEEHEAVQSFLLNWKNILWFDFRYSYSNKKNISGIEKCIAHRFEIEASYRMAKKGSLSAKIEYVHIAAQFLESGALAYEMQEGLQDGHNGLWRLTYDCNLNDFLQLGLSYEGRVSETAKTVHTGNVQLKAYF